MKSSVKTRTRIGKISYMNCLPFYHHLGSSESPPLELFEGVPVKINQLMHQGKIDMAPVSSLEYLNHQKDYLLLPHFAIGSRDFSGSVLLFSRERIEGLNRASIAVSRESLSSTALLKILLKFKYKFQNRFVVSQSDPKQMLSQNTAALVIGDDALLYCPKEFVYKYDLSELWWNWAEKPFCFALWAVRRPFAKRYPDEVAAFSKMLRHNLEKNLLDLEALLEDSLQINFLMIQVLQ